ncbi:MAG: pyruvate carboxylase subunit B [Kiritimatiellia bacterium]
MAKTTEKKTVRFVDTTLRDAHQSLWATRMRTQDILGILETVDNAGFYAIECWGGATFDVCMRFLREDPWERLRQMKAICKKTPLQMLLRGQNCLGYKHYPDDVLERCVAKMCENGMDIFRCFDALNDVRNLEAAIKAVKKYGGHAQGTICYTVSPVHTAENFVKFAKAQVDLGIDSIAIKDMAGILTPSAARELVGALKKALPDLPIEMHSHMTSGMAPAMYMAAVEAGAGAIDCSIATLSGFSSQPAHGTMRAIFEGLGYDTGLNALQLTQIDDYFRKLKPMRALKSNAGAEAVDVQVLLHHIPGGMISNMRSQLAQQDALDRLQEVLEELPRVRKDMGYPPLVTPTSQIMGVQAVLNVLAGKRYEMVSNETRQYVAGCYGRSPAPMDAKLEKKILGKDKKITCRPADLLKPGLADAAKELDPKLVQSEEDILSYCMFPSVAIDYFTWRATPEAERAPIPADSEMTMAKAAAEAKKAAEAPAPTPLSAEDAKFAMIGRQFVGLFGTLGGGLNVDASALAAMPVSTGDAPKAVAVTAPAAPKKTINATLTGTFYRADAPSKGNLCEEGATVKAGTPICVLEAMKLFNPVKAVEDCKILRFLVKPGENVSKGSPIAEIA